MTEQQFDKTRFGKGDKIEVRNYLKKETEDIELKEKLTDINLTK